MKYSNYKRRPRKSRRQYTAREDLEIAEYIVANPDFTLKQISFNLNVSLTRVYNVVRVYIVFRPFMRLKD